MTFEKIMTDLRNKKYAPIYFLFGDEPYYIDQISNYIMENVLSDSEKSFNQTVIYGKDTDTASVITMAKRYPMMASYQVVIVKEAQDLKNINDLVYYLDNPQKSTILVLNHKYKKLDKRKKVFTQLKKSGVLFESKKVYDNKIPAWIESYLKQRKAGIDQRSSFLLADYLGNNLSKIANELEKLLISLPANKRQITPELIERNIGISKDYNTFELTASLAKRDKLKAYRIINYFGQNEKEHPFPVVVAALFFYFSKVLAYHFLPKPIKSDNRQLAASLKVVPFFVKDYKLAARNFSPRKTVAIISILREYDLKSKGVNNSTASSLELMREMIYKILH